MVAAARIETSSIVVSIVSADSTTAPIWASTAVSSSSCAGVWVRGRYSVMAGPARENGRRHRQRGWASDEAIRNTCLWR